MRNLGREQRKYKSNAHGEEGQLRGPAEAEHRDSASDSTLRDRMDQEEGAEMVLSFKPRQGTGW